MALSDAQVFIGDGSTKDFTILGEIPSESHVRVWIDDVLQSTDSWDLLGNTVLFDTAPVDGSNVQFLVSTTGADFPSNPSAIGDVSINIGKVIEVADNLNSTDSIGTVATNLITTDTISTVAENLTTTDTIGTVANDLTTTNTIGTVADVIDNSYTFGGGQYLGTGVIKAVGYLSKGINEDLVVPSGLNAFSVGEVILENDASITVENNAIYKVL